MKQRAPDIAVTPMRLVKWTGGLLSFTLAAVWVDIAHAQEVVVAPRLGRTQTTTETVTEKGGPSRTLLTSGILTLGLTYGAGALVAATSNRDADHRMFVPVVGPWIALANRGDCGGATGRSCDTETTYNVLIVADGIGQGLGAFMIIDAFLNPERLTFSRTRTAVAKPLTKPTVRFSPASLPAGGYGVLAAGIF
jgi:hypothetical protein